MKKDILTFAFGYFPKTRIVISNAALGADKRIYAQTRWKKNGVTHVVVNPKKGGLLALIDTLVHEYLHVLYPEMLHKDVRAHTKAIVKVLSYDEKQFLLLTFAEAAEWRL